LCRCHDEGEELCATCEDRCVKPEEEDDSKLISLIANKAIKSSLEKVVSDYILNNLKPELEQISKSLLKKHLKEELAYTIRESYAIKLQDFAKETFKQFLLKEPLKLDENYQKHISKLVEDFFYANADRMIRERFDYEVNQKKAFTSVILELQARIMEQWHTRLKALPPIDWEIISAPKIIFLEVLDGSPENVTEVIAAMEKNLPEEIKSKYGFIVVPKGTHATSLTSNLVKKTIYAIDAISKVKQDNKD
jgi:hypothetical protein